MFKLKEGKIKPQGLFILMTLLLVTKLFLGVPQAMAAEGDTAAWLLILLSALAAIPGIYALITILTRFPGKNLIEISELLLGRAMAIIIGLTLSGFFILIASLVVREFAETMLTTVLPTTPVSVITFIFIVAMILGAYNGLEVITRSSTLLFPFIIGGILSILVLSLNFFNFNNLFPVLGSGLGKITSQAPGRSSMFMEIVFAGVISSNIIDTAKVPGAIWKAFLASVALFTVVEIFYIADLRVPDAERLYVPLFQLARLIYMGRFVQRIESVYIFIWFFIGALKLTIALYSAAVAFAWTFKIPIFQPLLFPLGLLVFATSFIPSGIVDAVKLDMEILREYGGIISWGIPLGLLLISLIRRKGGKKPEKQQKS